MAAKPTLEVLFADEYPRGGRPSTSQQGTMFADAFAGWCEVLLVRAAGEVDGVQRVWYLLEGRLTLSDMMETRVRDVLCVRCDADAQYEAIELLNTYTDRIDAEGLARKGDA